jgi:hypothetical protein
MKLIFLSQHNLADTFFMKSFVAGYKLKTPTVLLHDHFGRSPADTWFVTKRVSSLLSENMVVNNAFGGEQRGIFSQEGDSFALNADFLFEAFRTVHLVVLNPMVRHEGQSRPGDAAKLLHLLRHQLSPEETVLFPRNMKSPLGAERTAITSQEQLDRLLSLYEEEQEVLQKAWALRPAVLATPANFCP